MTTADDVHIVGERERVAESDDFPWTLRLNQPPSGSWVGHFQDAAAFVADGDQRPVLDGASIRMPRVESADAWTHLRERLDAVITDVNDECAQERAALDSHEGFGAAG
jgi:hypothetical protein